MCVFLAFAQTGTGQRWKLATVLSSGRHSEPPTEYISRPGVCGAEGKFLNNVENMVTSPSAAPPSYHVPLAYLPRLATTTGLLGRSFGSAALVALLGLDAWKSFRRKTHWIPGDSLILGALSLQLLSLLSRPIVTISDDQKLTESSVIELSDVIHENQLLILGGRVVMCVFIGNLLPPLQKSVERHGGTAHQRLRRGRPRVLRGLYRVLQYAYASNWPWDLRTISLLASNMARPPLGLRRAGRQEPSGHPRPKRPRGRPSSRIMVRTSDPQYLIARSALSASTAFLVTICAATFVVEWSVQGRLRWLQSRRAGTPMRLHVHRMRHRVVEMAHRPGLLSPLFSHGGFLDAEFGGTGARHQIRGKLPKAVRGVLHQRLLPVLVGLQILLVLLSKFCWLISQVLFSRECIRRLLMGSHGYREFAGLLQPQVSDTESSSFRAKYLPALIHLPHENLAGVWVAHRKSIENMRSRMEEAELKGKGFELLISLLRGKASPGVWSTQIAGGIVF